MVKDVKWVKCPVCGEPDMRKEIEFDAENGEGVIICTNLCCGSNGGDNFNAVAKEHLTISSESRLEDRFLRAVAAFAKAFAS